MDQFRSELVSWAAIERLSRRLAGKIRDSGFSPDIIVAVARGGYVPARLLCDYLDIQALSSIQIAHYTAGATKIPEARLVEIPSRDLRGKNVLLTDDVSDTGDTLKLARRHFTDSGVNALRIGVLHHKQSSAVKPDMYAQKIIKWRWLIYPWAVYEDVAGFIARLPEPPAGTDEAVRLLDKHFGLRIRRELMAEILRAAEYPVQGSNIKFIF
ncbi:MAG: phosphoribosyltransferase [Desulfobulbaceae bacterium]|nr:phosphoribosyltransferase [Desulfobulbaceae bacterium]